MTDIADPPSPADPRSQIAAEILRVHEDSYGGGAGSVTTHVLGDLVVVVLDALELSPSENTLIDGGHQRSVLSTRAAFQEAIEPTFRAIIERATGRRVDSFLSNTSLKPPFSVEIFRLAPAPGDGFAT